MLDRDEALQLLDYEQKIKKHRDSMSKLYEDKRVLEKLLFTKYKTPALEYISENNDVDDKFLRVTLEDQKDSFELGETIFRVSSPVAVSRYETKIAQLKNKPKPSIEDTLKRLSEVAKKAKIAREAADHVEKVVSETKAPVKPPKNTQKEAKSDASETKAPLKRRSRRVRK